MSKKKLDTPLSAAVREKIRWNEAGLIAAVAQDVDSGEILMLAWMNELALAETLRTGEAHYWSRSRHKLWHKGEESGQIQKVKTLLLDCDGDALIIKVAQTGVACHTGRRSCFFHEYTEDGADAQSGHWRIAAPVLTSPETLYAASNH